MLFLLTGNVQIGKTRWLQQAVADLSEQGVLCSGVLAPGDWVPTDGEDPDHPFEKLGIDNMLLPQGEVIPFARRQDLAREEGTYDAASSSAQAGLMWEISEDAIAKVNAHFEALAAGEGPYGSFGGAERPELLVVDEFGQLELRRNEGLTSALALVEAGSPRTAAAAVHPKHCLIIVRDALAPLAQERFAGLWGGMQLIGPNNDSFRALQSSLLLKSNLFA